MTRFLLTTRLVVFVCASNGAPFASPRTLYRRMNKLREAGFIDRFRLLSTGEYAYVLSKQGAEFLSHSDSEIIIPRKAFTPPSISLQSHEFEVSRFWIKFFSDSNKLHIPTLDFWRDGLFSYQTKDGKLIPDGTALLRLKGKTRVFFLEMDRSTQTRGSENQRGILYHKLMRYRQLSRTFRTHSQLEPYRPTAMQVMFVCRNQQRTESLCMLAENMNLGRLVYFTCLDRFLDITNPDTAQGWDYKSANLFAAPLFSFSPRSPPKPLL